jgi:hypothetical protein
MKRAMRAIPLTQEHDYIGEFHMATKKQIYNHMKFNNKPKEVQGPCIHSESRALEYCLRTAKSYYFA